MWALNLRGAMRFTTVTKEDADTEGRPAQRGKPSNKRRERECGRRFGKLRSESKKNAQRKGKRFN